jgi:hypothetical protein
VNAYRRSQGRQSHVRGRGAQQRDGLLQVGLVGRRRTWRGHAWGARRSFAFGGSGTARGGEEKREEEGLIRALILLSRCGTARESSRKQEKGTRAQGLVEKVARVREELKLGLGVQWQKTAPRVE